MVSRAKRAEWERLVNEVLMWRSLTGDEDNLDTQLLDQLALALGEAIEELEQAGRFETPLLCIIPGCELTIVLVGNRAICPVHSTAGIAKTS